MVDKINIFLVDDHPLIIEGVCRTLSSIPGVVVQDVATSGIEAISFIKSRIYDLYIIDVSLPDMSGFDLIEQIRKYDTEAQIIINTMHDEVWYINRMIAMGVNGIVLKASETNELKNAVLSVLNNDVYTCPRFAKIKQKLKASVGKFHYKDLPTKREQEVLQLLSNGLSSIQIAVQLGVTENTVETFRKRLIQKFDAKNAVDLVVKAISRGLIK